MTACIQYILTALQFYKCYDNTMLISWTPEFHGHFENLMNKASA